MKRLAALALLLLAAGPAVAATFTEDFEDYKVTGTLLPELKPDQDWYNYRDVKDIGNVSTTDPAVGAQSLRVASPAGVSVSSKVVNFDLEVPATLSSMTFYVRGTSITENGVGSNAFVAIESSAPRRTLVEFYVFCDDPSLPDGCEFRVRFENVDTTGQILVPATNNQTQFKVEIQPNWFAASYRLFVDDVDDGTFNFLELPSNIARVTIGQVEPDTPLAVGFDDWTIAGATEGAATVVEGDAALGIKNFLVNINFTSTGSLLAFGIVLFIVMLGAVITPLILLGSDNTVVPAVGVYAVLCALWLIKMEIWPDWMGILLIIVTAALVSLSVRRFVLGIRDASGGPGLVAGSLGYFIICSTLLAMSGYADTSISLPVEDLDDSDETENLNETESVEQGWFVAGIDCTVGILTFGKLGDCTRKTEGKAVKWAKETIDSIGRVTAKIFGYARAAVVYLFQLLTFQLPIPVLFNMMIVLPPASALATLAIQTIRGVG